MYVQLTEKRTAFTVGAGKNFSTVQDAINFWAGKVPSAATTISVDAGTYAEALLFNNHPYADKCTYQGDTRTAAGQHFATSGNITQVSGTHWKITLVFTPPADFGSGDYIHIGGCTTAANAGRFPLVSPYIDGKDVHFTNAAAVAEAVLAETRVVFAPNRIINATASGLLYTVSSLCAVPPTISGFTILNSTALSSGIEPSSGGKINCNKISAYALPAYGFSVPVTGGIVICDSKCSSVGSGRGFMCNGLGHIYCVSTYASTDGVASGYGYRAAVAGAFLYADNSVATKCTVSGFSSGFSAYTRADGSIASWCGDGYNTSYNGSARFQAAYAKHNTNGYKAEWNGTIYALNTLAHCDSNETNYLPGTSGTEGTDGGFIQFS